MPTSWEFNPPPNWPVPLQAPELDWQPDPAWGPPPVGWALWRRRRSWPARFRVAVTVPVAAGLTGLAGLAAALSISPGGISASTPPRPVARSGNLPTASHRSYPAGRLSVAGQPYVPGRPYLEGPTAAGDRGSRAGLDGVTP